MKKILSLLIIVTMSAVTFSQNNPISNTTLTTCEGFLFDSGLDGADYGPNENFTMVICSQTNTLINLSFNLFNVEIGDTLTIYDGSDITAPLIGSFIENELSMEDVTSTNIDGCLTLVWTSDAVGNGNFAAEISCTAPCTIFDAVILTNATDTASTILGCPGEEITFDASETIFAPGASVDTFEWDFYDGTTDNSSWPEVTHVFDSPGGYEITLNVTDNNGCEASADLVLLVSTYPDITMPEFQNICVGEGVVAFNDDIEIEFDTDVIEVVVDPVAIDFQFEGLEGEPFFIPDNQGCFENSIEVSGFAADAVIDDISLLNNFQISFEHSWMSDLTVSFTCPNNQSILVHNNGGSGTDLGNAIPSTGTGPGTGLDYYWAPDATNGTWAQEANGTALPSGTYSSVQSFNNLIGCPINGTWTLEICDDVGQDDGYIFDWSVAFDNSLYPDFIGATPVYGLECDSSFFSSELFVQEDDCSLTWSELATEPGEYPITFTTSNNFGCSFTEETSVTILNNPIADAGEDVLLCDEAELVQLNGSQSNVSALLGPHTHGWTTSEFLDPADLGQFTPFIDEDATGDMWFYFTVTPAFHPLCAHTDSVNIVIAPVPPVVISVEDNITELCANGEVELSVNEDYLNYEWNGDSELNTSSILLGPGTHTIVAYDAESCSVTTEVTLGTLPEVDFIDHSVCNELEFFVDDNFENIPGTWSYTTTGVGTLSFGANQSNSQLIASTSGTYLVSFTDECGFVDDFEFEIGVAPLEEQFTINSNFSICSSDFPFTLQPDGTDFDQYNWSWSDLETTPANSVSEVGMYTYTVSNDCGSDQDTTFINILPEVDFIDHFVCDELSVSIDDNITNVPGTWSYTSSNGGSLSFDNPTESNSIATASSQGTYQVTFTDECNLTDQFDITVLYAPLESQFTIEPFFSLCDDESPLVLSPEGNSADFYSWNWNTLESETSILVVESGEYTYTVSNDCGSASGSTYVEFLSCDITIPNIFTPNSSDLINNNFVIDGLHFFPGSALKIFNRWGNLIYESSDYLNDWSPSEDDVNDGTYYYILNVNRGDHTDDYSGYVNVKR